MQVHSCLFVVTPDELKEALRPLRLFIHNASVPIDYTETPKEVFIEKYTKLYELLCSGDKPSRERHGDLFDHFAVTADISSVIYGNEHICDGEKRKMFTDCTRGYPTHFAPFTFLTYEENGKLFVSTRASYLQYTEQIMGFQLEHLKIATKQDEEYWGAASEKELSSYKDYELFRKYIFSITSAMTFRCGDTVKKTQIRVSEEAKKHLPDFYCIKSKGITVC